MSERMAVESPRFARALVSILIALPMLLAGCVSNPIRTERIEDKPVQQANSQIPSAEVLDLWIQIFDPGTLPEDEDEARGLSMDIRNAEARFMPIHLAKTVERSGFWGAVRVVPQDTEGAEVLVSGTILRSDAEQVELRIQAGDARGEKWFERDYEHRVEVKDYVNLERGTNDAFQPLYNKIANDLIQERAKLAAADIQRIREIAEMRFAADMAPGAFGDYVWQDPNGKYHVRRLPAEGDPMLQRVRAIRDRDYLLVDTLNGHFDSFYNDTWTPYTDWRETRAEESADLREIEETALNRKILGALAVVGGIALMASSRNSDSVGTQTAKTVAGQMAVLGGVYAAKTGFDKDEQTEIHKSALEELGESFSQEAKPLVVEVDGETHRLTGSAESQYAQWRQLLKKIYANETGFPSRGD